MASADPPKHTNRLAGETSPYLLQHAHNPVDWYPWGSEALERARAEDKPILLSIGYSACHWCHVMERESFEDEATAALMNQHFVSVKVDREERPDLDSIYMQAVQVLTRSGGWPMTMFLTPDGTPFWGGTYFPPEDRGGMPSFKRVLLAIHDAWENRRADVIRSGEQLREHLRSDLQVASAPSELDPDLLREAGENLLQQYDAHQGGFGGAPKFPQPMAIEYLFRQWHRTGDAHRRDAAVDTLVKMAWGGMYDQLGGGFHRYSVDDHWLVPHFEKMLYDNAQLARAYLTGYQATGDPLFRRIAEETLDYVLRDLTDASGGFYSTEDADSEGEEGKFYVWTPSEIRTLLGEEDARLFCAYYGVTPEGNFEHGTSILHVRAPVEQIAKEEGVTPERLQAAIDRGRHILLAARGGRIRPGRDEKVLTAWNGLMLRAFAEAARVLRREDYRQAAERNAAFLLSTLQQPNGRLLRTWKPGHQAHLNGFLEDYANLADALVALYEASFDDRWLQAAQEIVEVMVAHFAAQDTGGFYDTSDDHERLITRPRDVFDNATPSGNSVAADVLLRLSVLVDRPDYRDRAVATFGPLREAMGRYPLGFGRLLCTVDFALSTPKEIALVGRVGSPEMEALLAVVYERYLPNKVVAGADVDSGEVRERIPLLRDREARGSATAYVCEHYTCLAPVTTPEELRQQLS